MIENTWHLRALALMILLAIFQIACSTDPGPPEPEAEPVAAKTGYQYDVLTDNTQEQELRASGNDFHVPTDNCGSRTSAFEEFSRSREFKVALNAEISESLRGQLGGDLVGGEIEAAVGAKLGVQIGATESVSTKRQITTPPDSLTDVTLQWEEIWQPGYVIVTDNSGDEIGRVPFRVLTTVRLSQIGIVDTPCGTLPAEESSTEESTAVPTKPAAVTPTAVAPVKPTDTAVPPTLTIVPATTTTTPSPTARPSPIPSPTNTPVGMMSKVYTVEGRHGAPQNTEVYVQAGDTVSFNYVSGSWWIGKGDCRSGSGAPQDPTDAGGYLGRLGDQAGALVGCEDLSRCRQLPSEPWGSLLGRIGADGALFHIGNEYEFVAQDSGLIYLTINYYTHNDVNSCPYGSGGEISTRITVTPS